jgi:hypothetical protein
MTLACTGHGKRARRKVNGKTKAAVVDKLRELHTNSARDHPEDRVRTLHRPAGCGRLARGRLDGRAAKTIKKDQNVLEPIPKVIGGRKLRTAWSMTSSSTPPRRTASRRGPSPAFSSALMPKPS